MSGKTKEKYGFPAILSFFIAGLGQIVKGEIGKGIAIIITQCVLGFLIGISMFTIIGPIVFGGIAGIVWVWNIYDAYNTQVE